MEIRTDNIVFSVTGEYLPHLIIGFFLWGAAGYCYGLGKSGWKSWSIIFKQINPSPGCHPSPFDQTLTGCGGLLTAWFCSILTIVFMVLGIEQFLFSGLYWNRFVDWTGQWLAQR